MIDLPPWLASAFSGIRAALADARLPHALLIHGPGGWGEAMLADAVALLLIERTEGRASAATLAHPDLRWIVPEGAGEQIGVDAVRGVVEFIFRTPQIAPQKVAVFTNADAFNAHSANALLKTLEEPPPNSYLLLVTESVGALLPTIRSRCRLVPVRPVDLAGAQVWVRQQFPSVDPERIASLCFEYGGAPLRVVEALRRDAQPVAAQLLDVAMGRSNPLALAEAWSKDDAVDVIERWLRHVSSALMQRRTATDAPPDTLAAALAQAPDTALFAVWEQLARDRALLRGTTNPNARLLLESELLRWRDLGIRARL